MSDTKSDNTKSDDTKPDDTKPDDTKPDDTKPDNTKPDDPVERPNTNKADEEGDDALALCIVKSSWLVQTDLC